MRFLADETSLGIFRVGDFSWYLCGTHTTVAYLSEGNKVRLDLVYKSKSNVFYDDPNSMLCNFSGHLIK